METSLWPPVHDDGGSGEFRDLGAGGLGGYTGSPAVVSPSKGSSLVAAVSSAGGSSDCDGEA